MSKKKGRPAGAPETAAPAPDLSEVVADYTAQAAAADQLAQVDTTHLDTPEANPQALSTLTSERTRTAREKIELGYARERLEATDDHQALVDQIAQRRTRSAAVTARTERAVSEGLADADEAAAELAQVRAFERGASPATATRRLMEAVRGWRREEFAYAIAGSGLSAAGVASLVKASTTLPWWGAIAVAVALEVVLTVRVIRLIGQRAELAEQHKGQALVKTSAGAKALTFLTAQIVGLLAASVALNLVGLAFFDTSALGVLGALGAGAAALASWSAWQASVAAAETVRSNITAWQGGDWAASREELRSRAAGALIPDLAEAPAPQAAPVEDEDSEVERIRRVLAVLADERITALADRGTDALAVMLHSGPPATPATGADQQVPQPATPAATVPHAPVANPAQEEEEQEEALEGRTWPRPVDPEQGRRQLIDYAQWQIGRGQAPGVRDAARRMNTSARSITRYKESLAGDYPELMAAFRQQP
ncbi:hypothetical protein Q8791_30495 [Nocardiopsis sp. CT-R113]|uniref:Uncharacterized protein n=1 Tax=Nocardiopsis codii TaxID=3065942 RepID=A0ABU7KH41_9ACTN|nr:hypothetical protein [Nocardiopsis sp. CT-R113]MEE2041560.1 hypothetical protein [Nocardiopsis sp. CT-R113]